MWKFVKSFRMNSYRVQFMFYGPEAQRHLISLVLVIPVISRVMQTKKKIAQKASAGQPDTRKHHKI